MLRLGTDEDISTVLAMVIKFFRHTEYGHLPVDSDNTLDLIRSFISNVDKDSVCILWEIDGKVSGILAGHILTIPLLSRKVAVECLWWVDPDVRGTEAGKQLLDAFEHWAGLRGASMIQMMSLPDKTGKLLSRYYRSRGYRLTEVTYTKEI